MYYKKSSDPKTNLLTTTISVFIIAIVLIVMAVPNYIRMKSEPVNLNKVKNWSEIKPNTHVKFKIYYCLDAYAANTTRHKVAGVTVNESESSRNYMIPHFAYKGGILDIDCIIGYRSSSYSQMEKMIDSTWDYLEGRDSQLNTVPIEFDGLFKKMSNKEFELMKEYVLDYYDLTEAEVEDYVLPYKLETCEVKTQFILIIIAIVLLGVGVITLLLYLKKRKEETEIYTSSAGKVLNDDFEYYGPEGSNAIKAPTYQYGGTNTYGQDNMYTNGATSATAGVYDETTGLSADFLKRSAEEKAKKEEEERLKNMTPNMPTGGIYGTGEAIKPQTAGSSFAQYDNIYNNTAVNPQGGINFGADTPVDNSQSNSNPLGANSLNNNQVNFGGDGIYGGNYGSDLSGVSKDNLK